MLLSFKLLIYGKELLCGYFVDLEVDLLLFVFVYEKLYYW